MTDAPYWCCKQSSFHIVSYPESVSYLYSLGNELKAGAKFGLEPMQALLAGLNHPEHNQRFVHIAGTNGKGSTCALIESVLRHAGYRSGLYTSPHLVAPTERIQISGEPISQEEFARAFEVVHTVAEAMVQDGQIDAHPSYFETVTAMALIVFRQQCDIAVLEVGLGGRLDATNVIHPELTVVTPVAFDHESFLGNTLEAIASEKAGILKPQVPLVLSRQQPAAESVILDRARQLGCQVVRTADASLSIREVTSKGSVFLLDGFTYECALPGRHQIENSAAAILACRLLNIDESSIQAGIKLASWPGRLERLARHPDFILDGAHNPAGAAALAAYIREFCQNRPVWLVYGAMRDKAIEEVTSQLFPLAQHLIVTMPDFPRALRPEAILEVNHHPNAVIAPTISQAIALARAAPPNAVVFFTGSLFVVGEVRGLLSKTGQVVR
jgi:dihydrofolate synthase/folylpolyglutamate synthase